MFTKPYHPGQHGDPSYSVKANKKTKSISDDNTTLATSISKGMKILLRTVKRESHNTGLLLLYV